MEKELNPEQTNQVTISQQDYERLQSKAQNLLERFENLPDKLTEQEVWDTMKFVSHMNKNISNSIFSPYLVNNAMNRVNNNIKKPTQADIDKNILNIYDKSSQDQILSYSDFYDFDNMMYRRMVNKIAHMPSFDMEFDCLQYENNNQYYSDEGRLEDFVNKFDYRNEFGRIAKILTKKEIYYGVLRANEDMTSFALQELPSEYCRIDGRHNHGFAFSFNTEWFRQSGVDIRMYPKVLQDAYYDLYLDSTGNSYDPSAKLNKRDGTWTEWVQVKPEDGFWCFKFDESNVAQFPFFAPMFRELAYQDTAEELQNNEFLIKASQIVMAAMGIQQNTKNGQAKDNFELTIEAAADFSTLARQELGDLARFVATPFKDAKLFSSDLSTNNILNDYKKITSTSFGGASTALYTSEKLIEKEATHAIETDIMLAESMYPTFEKFIEYYVNSITKKYKFSIKFKGVNLPSYRKEKLTQANADLQSGIIDYQNQASARKLNYFEFKKRLQHSQASGIDNLIRVFGTANNVSDKGGRPNKDESSGNNSLDEI